MSKLSDLIKEYQERHDAIDKHISTIIKKIEELGLSPIFNKTTIDNLNVHLRACQSAKNLHQIFINDLKSLKQ